MVIGMVLVVCRLWYGASGNALVLRCLWCGVPVFLFGVLYVGGVALPVFAVVHHMLCFFLCFCFWHGIPLLPILNGHGCAL